MPEVTLRLLTRDEISVTVEPREARGKGAMGRLRREEARIPGILYGHGEAPYAFKTDARALERIFARNGQSVLFRVEAGDGSLPSAHAIVRDIQYHKVSGAILHVDLLRIDANESRVITVPVHTRGVPEGVRVGGGALQHAVTTLEMECVISQMPAAVEIDIESLEIGDSIHVADLLEQEPRIVTDPEVAIVNVLAPRLTIDEELSQAEGEEEAEAAEEGEGEEETAEAEDQSE
jgi:large subunit ribosomal protein L25